VGLFLTLAACIAAVVVVPEVRQVLGPNPTPTPDLVVYSGTETIPVDYLFDFDVGVQSQESTDILGDFGTGGVFCTTGNPGCIPYYSLGPLNGAGLLNLGFVDFDSITLGQLSNYKYDPNAVIYGYGQFPQPTSAWRCFCCSYER
jgi:hypothetical protein